MKTKILITAILCIALAACGNNSRKRQDQPAQEPEMAEPQMAEPGIAGIEDTGTYRGEHVDTEFTDTLQFIEGYEDEDGYREFFLTKNYEILRMYPMEDRFNDKDENKLFVISWQLSEYSDGSKELSVHNRREIPGVELYVMRRHYSQDDGNTNINEEIYKNKTLKDVYGIIVRNQQNFNEHLRDKLPKGNMDYKSDELGDVVEVSYRFKTSKQLTIELNYPGGITTVEIEESPGKTVSKITYSAD